MPPAARLLPDPALLARLGSLELRARAVVEGWLAGRHRSPGRGFSVEFAEHREYSPGDDLRYLDWKVFGKRDRFQVKQFEAETNLACTLAVDVSESMTYRSPAAPWTKLDCAKTAAAALASLVLKQNDAAGCATFDDDQLELLRASGKGGQWGAILHRLENAEPRAGGGTAAAAPSLGGLHALADRLPPRSVVILLSDALAPAEDWLAAIKHLRHARHDVVLLQVIDPAEAEFPFEGVTLFRGLEGLGTETLDARSLADAYREEFGAHVRALSTGCRDLGGDYALVRTDAPLDFTLAAFLTRRR
ncbi:MAG: DUF58 domain-containing protein [Planctomyces sp.]|nr:DUF58 domain-containing protein [Planctomyces sp.]